LATIQERLKSLVLTHAPPAALLWLKKRHYVRAVKSFYEPDTEIMHALVGTGDMVLDIGANVGWYTYLLSKCVGPRGQVTSIEPVPPTFEILSHCVRALELPNVNRFKIPIA